ncbi:N-acetyltransferase [Paenibacillus psychroresistens]|uniref:N-acetyltransferase n=1 Tax=Paenibacillus psychroresistens TaxID=1778678 RepID=A0A6B8RW78_9BACL|nr:GNAT family N-acetyltransferase [Paenibacillus psychroresistens]QGR00035.1 N-acetyltransferase [Paenibacillus psychroresistens]
MQPIFETERLVLRPFELTDASKVQELAGDKEVAKTTLSIPYPYPDGAAESWIRGCNERSKDGSGFPFALVDKDKHLLIGCMSINVSIPHKRGELAYWLGRPFWGNGYATEAAMCLVAFGFKELELNKIWAAAMTKNPASTNVMKKLGMKFEGEFKKHILKWNEFEDVIYYGMTKDDYDNMNL